MNQKNIDDMYKKLIKQLIDEKQLIDDMYKKLIKQLSIFFSIMFILIIIFWVTYYNL